MINFLHWWRYFTRFLLLSFCLFVAGIGVTEATKGCFIVLPLGFTTLAIAPWLSTQSPVRETKTGHSCYSDGSSYVHTTHRAYWFLWSTSAPYEEK